MHTNTTPEHYMFLHSYIPVARFGRSIEPSSVRGQKYVNAKVSYISGHPSQSAC